MIRSWRLTGWQPAGLDTVAVTSGPRGMVWVGYLSHLRRLNPRTGATLGQVRPASRHVVDVAADPSGRHVYVATRLRKGGVAISAYAGGSGRLLAYQAGLPLRYSSGGATLTAVPGGVWVSFRTGMLGQTVLLRRHGLVVAPLPGRGRPWFSGWAMGVGTSYGSGSLWLSQSIGGRTACIAPATGRVRSSARLRQLENSNGPLAVSSAARLVYAVSPQQGPQQRPRLLAISAPRVCWR